MKNVHEITIKIEGKQWTDILDNAFLKKKKDIKVDGFRKGNVPKNVFIKKVGIESLYMDAVDVAMPIAYKKALDENKVIPVIEPKIDVVNINENEVEFKFIITTKPEIKLGEYKNLGIKKKTVKVTKSEIDEEIKSLQTKYAEIVEKENGVAEIGDTATIDFKGFVDGKELDGGSGANYPLELGSKTFIPGFEEAVVGMKIDEEKQIDLKFPEDYTEDLKGKDVTFNVTLRGLKTKVLPEINEDFFLDLGYDDVKTKEELEQKVKEDIKAHKEHHAEDEYIESCMQKAADNMKVELSDEIIDDEIHHMIKKMEDNLKMQGLTLEQYMSFTGLKEEDLHKQMEAEATKRIKYRYLLEEIIEVENIEVSDEEVETEVANIAKDYDMTLDEVKKEIGNMEMLAYDLKMRKALDIIKG